MTPAAIETTIARHDERIIDAEEAIKRIEGKLDKLMYGALATLVTTVGTLVVLLLKTSHG